MLTHHKATHPPLNHDNALTSRYDLLVGLDCEYTTSAQAALHVYPSSSTPDSNHLISYQLYAYAPLTSKVHSVVVYTDGQRLTLAELIDAAIELFTPADLNIEPSDHKPLNVCVVTHFGAAEWSHVADRSDLVVDTATPRFKSSKPVYAMSDLRKTPKVRNLPLHSQSINRSVSLDWRDTFPLAPTGSGSLESLGVHAGVAKVDVTGHDKGDMLSLLASDTELFYRYALTDAEIGLKYILNLHDVIQAELHINRPVNTLGALSTEQYLHALDTTCGMDERALRSGKAVDGSVGQLSLAHDAAFTASYFGGYNIAYLHCEVSTTQNQVILDIDLAGAYPAAMSVIAVPNTVDTSTGTPLTIDNIIEVVERRFSHTTADGVEMTLLTPSWVKCDFKFPPDTKYPCLPVSADEAGLCYPLTGKTICSGLEAVQALKMGCEFSNLTGFAYEPLFIERHGKSQVIPAFADILGATALMRKAAPPKSLQNLLWKEVRNSLYGKTAQGLRNQSVVDLRGDSSLMPHSSITNAAYAQTTTAVVRCALVAMVDASDKLGALVTCATTDGYGCRLDVEPAIYESIMSSDNNKAAVAAFTLDKINPAFYAAISNLPEVQLMAAGLAHQGLDPASVLEIKSFGDRARIAKTRGYLMNFKGEYTQVSTCGISIKAPSNHERGLIFEGIIDSPADSSHAYSSLTTLKQIAAGKSSDLVMVDKHRMTNTSYDFKRNIAADGKSSTPWVTVEQMHRARQIQDNIRSRNAANNPQGSRPKVQIAQVQNVMAGLRNVGSCEAVWVRSLIRLISDGSIKLMAKLPDDTIVERLADMGVKDVNRYTLKNARRLSTGAVKHFPDTAAARNFVDAALMKLDALSDSDLTWFVTPQSVKRPIRRRL